MAMQSPSSEESLQSAWPSHCRRASMHSPLWQWYSDSLQSPELQASSSLPSPQWSFPSHWRLVSIQTPLLHVNCESLQAATQFSSSLRSWQSLAPLQRNEASIQLPSSQRNWVSVHTVGQPYSSAPSLQSGLPSHCRERLIHLPSVHWNSSSEQPGSGKSIPWVRTEMTSILRATTLHVIIYNPSCNHISYIHYLTEVTEPTELSAVQFYTVSTLKLTHNSCTEACFRRQHACFGESAGLFKYNDALLVY